ncbi:hypothetical protein DFH27DRAFT_499124 [Peziza echinospora]|nr:hypothetical protein DFH27DRAFT_499124 [Peziza echinospora]
MRADSPAFCAGGVARPDDGDVVAERDCENVRSGSVGEGDVVVFVVVLLSSSTLLASMVLVIAATISSIMVVFSTLVSSEALLSEAFNQMEGSKRSLRK